jgi:GH43 family beta-xylosidase
VPTRLWRDSNPHIYIVAMSNPWTVTGSRTAISAPTYAWEQQGTPMNEGPVAIQRNGRTFVTYSASACQGPDHKIGQLTYTGGDVLSAASWVKKSTPIFQRNDTAGVYGPGHHGFFTSPDGTEDWIVYHANSSPSQGCGATRTIRIQRVSWNADGSPNLGVPVSTSTVLAPPSGEPAGPTVPVNGLQSYNAPDRHIRHYNYLLRLDPISTAISRADATFHVTS